MSDGGAEDPLRDLGQRLDKARGALDRKATSAPSGGGMQGAGSALGLAWRIGMELVIAVVVGTGIGWAIDHWLGTRPWAMIVMFFLGVAAGMVNVYRTVMGLGMAVGYRGQNQGPAAGGAAKGQWDEDED